MGDTGKDTEQLLAEAESNGYVDAPPVPVEAGHPDWVAPAEGVTPAGGPE